MEKMDANLSARSSRSQPDSSVGADRSFSLVSDSPGPSFATVSGAVRSSGPFDVPSAVAAAHRGLPAQGMKFLWEGGFWQQIFGPSDPLENMYGSIFKRPEAPLLEESEMPPRKTVRPSSRTVGAVHGSFLDAVREREVLGWKQKRDKERAEALSLWEVLITSWPSNLSVISQLRSATPAARKSMVEDLLGGNSAQEISIHSGVRSFLEGARCWFPRHRRAFLYLSVHATGRGQAGVLSQVGAGGCHVFSICLGHPGVDAFGREQAVPWVCEAS